MVRKLKLITCSFSKSLAGPYMLQEQFPANIHQPFPKMSCQTKPPPARAPLLSFRPLGRILHRGTRTCTPCTHRQPELPKTNQKEGSTHEGLQRMGKTRNGPLHMCLLISLARKRYKTRPRFASSVFRFQSLSAVVYIMLYKYFLEPAARALFLRVHARALPSRCSVLLEQELPGASPEPSDPHAAPTGR